MWSFSTWSYDVLDRSVYKSAMVQIAFDDCERAELISKGEEED